MAPTSSVGPHLAGFLKLPAQTANTLNVHFARSMSTRRQRARRLIRLASTDRFQRLHRPLANLSRRISILERARGVGASSPRAPSSSIASPARTAVAPHRDASPSPSSVRSSVPPAPSPSPSTRRRRPAAGRPIGRSPARRDATSHDQSRPSTTQHGERGYEHPRCPGPPPIEQPSHQSARDRRASHRDACARDARRRHGSSVMGSAGIERGDANANANANATDASMMRYDA